jgi:hypothetical protein
VNCQKCKTKFSGKNDEDLKKRAIELQEVLKTKDHSWKDWIPTLEEWKRRKSGQKPDLVPKPDSPPVILRTPKKTKTFNIDELPSNIKQIVQTRKFVEVDKTTKDNLFLANKKKAKAFGNWKSPILS